MNAITPVASYLSAENLGPWEIYIPQIEEVAPHLAPDLRPWMGTLTSPKRC